MSLSSRLYLCQLGPHWRGWRHISFRGHAEGSCFGDIHLRACIRLKPPHKQSMPICRPAQLRDTRHPQNHTSLRKITTNMNAKPPSSVTVPCSSRVKRASRQRLGVARPSPAGRILPHSHSTRYRAFGARARLNPREGHSSPIQIKLGADWLRLPLPGERSLQVPACHLRFKIHCRSDSCFTLDRHGGTGQARDGGGPGAGANQ